MLGARILHCTGVPGRTHEAGRDDVAQSERRRFDRHRQARDNTGRAGLLAACDAIAARLDWAPARRGAQGPQGPQRRSSISQ
jgi:hypothetical protein